MTLPESMPQPPIKISCMLIIHNVPIFSIPLIQKLKVWEIEMNRFCGYAGYNKGTL